VGPQPGDDSALLRSQGGLIPQWSSSWRLGELFLFTDRFAFAQPGRPRVEVLLATVTDVAMERRKFILLHKDVVRLKYVLAHQTRPRLVWFITADAGRWFDELVSLTGGNRTAAASGGVQAPGVPDGPRVPPVGSAAALRQVRRRTADSSAAVPARAVLVRETQAEELATTLSPAGARILWHLWERGHADIKELARVADSRSHMEVLTLLREGINGASERLFGGPAVVFKERAVDPVSGHAVCFQWWLERAEMRGDIVGAGEDRSRAARPASGASWAEAGVSQGGYTAPPADTARSESAGPGPAPAPGPAEPLVEIHDEGDTVIVVIMGPGVGAEAVRHPEVRGDTLIVTLEAAAGSPELSVPLPCAVQPAPLRAAVANGVASLTLVKKTREERR
jgi:HSP20 family molecular chaperone IbpA